MVRLLAGLNVDIADRLGWLFCWMHPTARGRGITTRATVPVIGRTAMIAWVVGMRWQGRGLAAQAAGMLIGEVAHGGVTCCARGSIRATRRRRAWRSTWG